MLSRDSGLLAASDLSPYARSQGGLLFGYENSLIIVC